MATPRVVLITKADCHLCEEARQAVGRVTAALGLEWTEEPVDHQPELRERYAEEIPVVLVDGVQRDFWKIDEARLHRVLQRAMSQ
ncbi:glutaredoxin family protein [Pseudarthrobacter sp. NS4]|uniref:glutaredoxin family protein n=1 Tax=Pseudarthrobacter sp. NS4 TaxID=2973976 RepID=UPI002163BDB3|nr:glutaredoxin family protein [Pseudarthrobacter sp. NS4]